MPCRHARAELRSWRGNYRSPRCLSVPCRRNWRRAYNPPSPPSRQYSSAWPTASDVGAASGRFIDGARNVHHDVRNCSVSPAAHYGGRCSPLAVRCRKESRPRPRQPDQRIDVGKIDPARAAIERHPEARNIGEAAAAGPTRRLHHDDAAVRRHDAARGGDTGSARADHDDIGIARHCGPRRGR